MKQLIFIGLVSLFLATSCKKEKKVDEVIYEVTLTSASTWHGGYVNENAQAISITGGTTNWRYTFKNSNNLATAVVQAYPDGTNPSADALMKIYVNGSVVAQGKSSVSPQVQYIFP